ncbi:MAG: aminotransferase class V-fold PLP-dependent enzyme, partial [Gammaproteobacteria bacterium]|nr:aminotransferase class V-fold PLP-dependent enzyme [Gammaproteobacteria bacterium]
MVSGRTMSKSGSSASPSSWPHYDDDQIAAVARVLASGKTNYWTGSECRHFEREFAIHFDMPFAISLANGTVALELALIAFGIGHDDEVIVPAASYIASAGCVAVRGARPVFADVDEHTQNISAKTIEPLINSRTRAVIVVHLHGVPCDMAAILKLAKKQKLLVIEDCAQAHGAQYRGQPAGSLGDAAAFSFCQDKIISTGGEGGMLLFRDRIAWQNGWSYKD